MPTLDREKAVLIYDYFLCVPGKINGVDCHFCVKKSMQEHGSIFTIAPVKLRDELNLKDGDLVNLEWV